MSRTIVTKEICTEIKCDFCERVQMQERDIHWSARYNECSYHIPRDGLNGGAFKGDLCPDCREKLLA